MGDWTKETPTVPGLWLMQPKGTRLFRDVIPIEVSVVDGVPKKRSYCYAGDTFRPIKPGALWLGPLPEPNKENTNG